MKTLYIEWNDPSRRSWVTVGQLTETDKLYTFQYTKGAYRADSFTPFGRMTSLDGIYESDELFPLFKNRLLNKSRPEYRPFMSWLDLSKDANPLDILAVSQGLRVTDSLRIFSLPTKTSEGYTCKFFASGISHLSVESTERIASLSKGDPIYLMDDIQNEFKDALTLRTGEPKALAGYCPSFLSSPLKRMLAEDKESVAISITKVNVSAPTRYRLLCTLSIKNDSLTDFFADDDHQTINNSESSVKDFASAIR